MNKHCFRSGTSYDVSRVNTWRAAVPSNSGPPATTIIGGYTEDNMPVGLELIGGMYSEGNLVSLAYDYENHYPERPIPTIPSEEKPSPLLKMSIPQINNTFTLIGYASYRKFLKSKAADEQIIRPQDFAKLVKQVFARSK